MSYEVPALDDRAMSIDQSYPRELTVEEIDAVSGGGCISDFIDRVVATYHFLTGTITSHATTLP
jgi:hypothetical protein